MKTQQQVLQRARAADFQLSLEPDGTPTDHYRVVASDMFGVPYDQVTEQQRRAAKRASFFALYR